MSEAPLGIDRYRELTPQQRHVEFNKIYESIPGTISAREEYLNKLEKNVKLRTQAYVDKKGMDWFLNHPDHTSDSELKRLNKENEDVKQSRSQSDQKKELLGSLTSLLDYCSGTNVFKEHLIKMFGFLFDRGVDRSQPEDTVFEILKLEQLNNPGSGGIFDDDNIEMLEKSAFKHAYLSNSNSNSMLDQLGGTRETLNDISESIGLEEKITVSFGEFITRDNSMIKNWRQQFKDRYRKLPNVA